MYELVYRVKSWQAKGAFSRIGAGVLESVVQGVWGWQGMHLPSF
jgi:hypothetical protein